MNVIFGYGSLINLESLKATAPNATDICPAYIKGFIRSFSVWDSVGWTETNPDLAGQPMCAVDIQAAKNIEARVNGVVFSVSSADLQLLISRERNYKLIETSFYDFESDRKLGTFQVFSANKQNGSYAFNNAAQARYLQICLDSARQFGEQFYQEFLDTTYIGDKRLSEFPELIK